MREVVCFPIACHSCFFDGAFVVALVGLTTVKDLWDLLGDHLTVSMVTKKTLSCYICIIHGKSESGCDWYNNVTNVSVPLG